MTQAKSNNVTALEQQILTEKELFYFGVHLEMSFQVGVKNEVSITSKSTNDYWISNCFFGGFTGLNLKSQILKSFITIFGKKTVLKTQNRNLEVLEQNQI